nr:zinc finger, CCHC-type [Tanacetum cinerariifolium]
MKDMGEADIILDIRIKHKSNGIAISQSHYIKKVMKKFNYFDCTLGSTPMDTSDKLMPNNGQAISQLEYSRVLGCLMYAITYTRPDIAFAVNKLSMYTGNPSTHHWQVIQHVLRNLKKTMNYRLTYTGYPSVLEGAGKEAEWMKIFLLEILLWSKPIAPISIRYDSAATLAKAYSQMYNRKSGHLGVRHNMIRELIRNEAFRFYVIEPNNSVSINSIIELMDAIFVKNRFSSVSRPSQKSLVKGTKDSCSLVVPKKVTEEDDPKTFDEAMKSQDVAFWKKQLKMRWIPSWATTLGALNKSQGYYFDTYALVARISTIRLLIAMASIHNLIIYQMDVKTAFLNGDLDEEVPKQWHQKFDEVVFSNGYLLNQDEKCVYSKFDKSGKGVIICLYVDDMLIFGTH